MDDDQHLLPSRQRRFIFYGLMSFFAIKYGLHIAVHVFQINAIFGILIGIAMAAVMIYTFKSIFDRADRQEIEHYIQNCVLPKLPQKPPADRANPWYVGLNDDRSHPKDL